MKILYRLSLIVCAYLASAIVAAIVAFGGTMLFSVLSGQRVLTKLDEDTQWLGIFILLTALFALLPSLVAILIAETFRIRSALAHVAVSTAIGVSILIVAEIRSPWFFHGPESIINSMRALWVAGSMIAGIIYWLIAGRRAGVWKA